MMHFIGKYIPPTVKKPFNYLYSLIRESTEGKRLIGLYSQFIKKGDLVFDIGANIGNQSEMFLKLGAKIIAVEPNPDLIEGLKKRFSGKEVIIVNKGISSLDKTLKFKIFKDLGHCTFADEHPTSQKPLRVIEVETITLNSLIKDYGKPKFIKIDVEGFEYEVLKTLKQKINMICFEFLSERKEIYLKSIKYLQKIGYKEFNLTLNIDHKFINQKWMNSNEVIKQIQNLPENCLFGDVYARA
jgi:FkbM family methyltransferase